jgi:nicotinamidase-related amidase
MVRDRRTAREIFEEIMADRGREKFGFGDRLAIVNVDLQRAYTDLQNFKSAYETDPNQIEHINRISALARRKGMPVVWTRVGYMAGGGDAGVWGSRSHTPDSLKSIERGSERWEFDRRCDVLEDKDAIYTKRVPSAFFETPLASWLVWHKVDTVVVTGGSTSGCVRATAVDSVSHGYRTIVPIECVADKHESYHFASLTDLQLNYSDVEPVQSVTDWLHKRPDV